METKLISIITPAYNAGLFIEETIVSVQAQTYPHWEMIIVNDGSKDNTEEIVLNLVAKDNRIKYFSQKNGRQGKARNYALEQAKGSFIAFLDADDLWVPEKLEKQLKVIYETGADLVHSQGWVFTENISNKVSKIKCEPGFADSIILLKSALNGYCVPILGILAKSASIKSVGGFNEDLRLQNAEDYHLILKLIDADVKFYGMQDELIYYRLHSFQITASDSNATIQALWALYLSDLKNITAGVKHHLITNRLNRFLLHDLSEHNTNKINEIVAFYRIPLRAFVKWFVIKIFILLGKSAFNWFGYRFLDLRLLKKSDKTPSSINFN